MQRAHGLGAVYLLLLAAVRHRVVYLLLLAAVRCRDTLWNYGKSINKSQLSAQNST